MNKKNCIEIGKIGCALVWVSKDNKKIYRYDIKRKKMYRGNFEIYSKKYLKYFVNHWDKFTMFHYLLINAKDQYKTTSLMWAAYYNNLELVKLLIEKGVDVNAKNKYRGTVLFFLSGYNNEIELAKLLIAKGADVNEKNNDGYKTLDCTYTNNNTELANLLIEKGAKE